MKKTHLKRSSKSSGRSNTLATPRPSDDQLQPHVIAILGTTASGKSDLALKLARHFKGIIIAADARTIYRGLDIGTAKPTKTEQKKVPHFMIDVASPRQTYSAQKYQAKVRRVIHRLQAKPIFLVGGNGLYLDAVLKGLDFAQARPDKRLRARLNKKSLPELNRLLRQKDPLGYKKVDLHNKRRVVRALEVRLSTGKSLFATRNVNRPDFAVLKIGLTKPRAELHQRIIKRVDKMFRRGWISEVKKLLTRYPASSPGFSAHGYPEIIKFLKGNLTKEEAKVKISHNVWLYAKRQLNWFKRDPDINWLDPTEYRRAKKLVVAFLKK